MPSSRTSRKKARDQSVLPWVVPEYCEGCTACVAACPAGVIAMRPYGEDGFIPWIDSPDQCIGCGRCEAACILGGIAMTTYVEDARSRFECGVPPV